MEQLNIELNYNLSLLDCTKRPDLISREIKRIINLGADVNFISFVKVVISSIPDLIDVFRAFIYSGGASVRFAELSYVCAATRSKKTIRTLLDAVCNNYKPEIRTVVEKISSPVRLHKARLHHEVEYTSILDMLICEHF